jgi:DNA polymerase epsilon subunit 2
VKPSLFPPPAHKTEFFRQRYHIVHQRILRNDGFDQQPMAGTARTSQQGDGSAANKITPITNLLGRTNTPHLLLGLLIVLPTGALGLSDLSGSIALDIQHARPFPDPSAAWFCPGMMLLADGVYIEDGTGSSESALGSIGGIGATIGGKFVASVVAHPPCERRATTLGIPDSPSAPAAGPSFGWTDFLGVGSERATGARMRRLQARLLDPGGARASARKIAVAADVRLDSPAALAALRTLLAHYDAAQPAEAPLCVVLAGDFARAPALAAAAATALDYREAFNGLAALLSEFPRLLAATSLVLVPGDGDAWPSAFAAGSAVPLPRRGVPDVFTTRVRRAVAEANREAAGGGGVGGAGSVTWASNPARVSWFGCAGEMVVFRDDVSGRLRRSAVRFPSVAGGGEDDEDGGDAMQVDPAEEELDPDLLAARRLTKTLLDQAHLAPFPLAARPVLWDYAAALSLYPLPTALVVADPDAPSFAINYMGCCVMNPGRIVQGAREEMASWVEFDPVSRKGEVVVKGEAS